MKGITKRILSSILGTAMILTSFPVPLTAMAASTAATDQGSAPPAVSLSVTEGGSVTFSAGDVQDTISVSNGVVSVTDKDGNVTEQEIEEDTYAYTLTVPEGDVNLKAESQDGYTVQAVSVESAGNTQDLDVPEDTAEFECDITPAADTVVTVAFEKYKIDASTLEEFYAAAENGEYDLKQGSRVSGGGLHTDVKTYTYNSTVYNAYCLDYGWNYHPGHYDQNSINWKNEKFFSEIAYIIQNGATLGGNTITNKAQFGTTGSADNDYFATQIAVWFAVYENNTTGSYVKEHTYEGKDPALYPSTLSTAYSIAHKLYDSAKSATEKITSAESSGSKNKYGYYPTEYSVTPTTNKFTLSEDKQYYQTSWYTVKEVIGSYFWTKKTDPITVTLPSSATNAGFTTEISWEKESENIYSGTRSGTPVGTCKFRIKIPVSKANVLTDAQLASFKSISINIVVNELVPYFTVFYRTDGSSQNVALLMDDWERTRPYSASATYDIPPQKGYAKVQKTATGNTEGRSIAGAEYTIYDSNKKVLGKLTTKTDGSSNTLELEAGTYYIKETKAPDGFNPDSSMNKENDGAGHKFTVKAGETATISSTDALKPGYITLQKSVDSNCENVVKNNRMYSLEGAVYKLYSDEACTKEAATFTTKADGSTNSVELNAGTYYLKEITAPKGYILKNDIQKVTVTAGQSQTIKVSDTPALDPTHITILKTGTGSEKLAGAEFTIKYYDAEEAKGDPLYTWVIATDKNGEAWLANEYIKSGSNSSQIPGPANGTYGIPIGTYTIQETKAPSGYTLDGSVSTYKVARNSAMTGVTHECTSGNKNFTVYNKEENSLSQVNPRPSIGTTAKDGQTGDNSGTAANTTLVDTVSYNELTPGKKYTVTGTLMDKTTGKAFESGGKTVTASTTFTAPASDNGLSNGSVDVTFTFDASGLGNHDLVVYETLKSEDGNTTVEHKDLSDEGQTVHYQEIHTTATDGKTKDHSGTLGKTETIVDKVVCKNLVVGKEYTINGKLMNKDTGKEILGTDGKPITASTTFTATEKNPPDVELVYTLDSSILEGQTVVVFEDLYHNGIKVATHSDITDEEQSVHYPKIRTEATDFNTKTHSGELSTEATIVDEVSYENLIIGKEYTITGKLVNKDTGEPILDADKNEIVATDTFTAEKESDTRKLTYKVDTSAMEGQTIVVFEDLYHNGIKVATHSDITDEEQSVHYPKIRTEALDIDTETHTGKVDGNAVIKDIVTWENLVPGETYVVKGILMNRDTGKELAAPALSGDDADAASTGSTAVDTADTAGTADTVTSPEEEGPDQDNTGEASTIAPSEIETDDTVESAEAPSYAAAITNEPVSDKSENETPDKTVDTDTPDTADTALDAADTADTGTTATDETVDDVPEDQMVVSEMTIIPTEENAKEGTVELTFRLNSENVKETPVVVFERLYNNEVNITSHTDIDDENQTVRYPVVGTTAIDGDTQDHVGRVTENMKINDKVSYTGLTPGHEYTVKGKIMDRETGKVLTINGQEITGETTFTAEKANDTVDVAFTLDSTALAGHTLVVYEKLYDGDVNIASHEDIGDEDQSVFIPEIHTNAVDKDSQTHTGKIDEKAEIVDTVSYTNLVPGQKYTVSGTLMNKETGEALEDKNGNPVTTTTEFTPDEKEGSVDLIYTLDSSLLEGKTVVVFEDLLHNDLEVTSHADINDEDQSVHYPEIHTNATDNDTKNHVAAYTEKQTITDTVTYKNLIPGKEYVVKGTLMDKETGKPVEKKVVSGSPSSAASATSANTAVHTGSDYTLKAGSYAVYADNKGVVSIFLKNTDGKYKNIETGEELDDSIKAASFTLDSDGTYTIAADTDGKFTVERAETAENAETAQTAGTIAATEASTQAAAEDTKKASSNDDTNENAVTATVTFTPEKADGTVDLTYTLDSRDVSGKTFVVFEDLYSNDVKVTSHADLEDKDQTIYYPSVKTTATGSDGKSKEFVKTSSAKILDTVSYTNLSTDKEYTVKGTLMNKATGKPVAVNGKEVTSEKTFTPDAESSTVQMEFTFDASSLGGAETVVFENIYQDDVLVGTHADINDADQTVKINNPSEKATSVQTGDNFRRGILIGGIALAGVLATAAVFVRRRRRI